MMRWFWASKDCNYRKYIAKAFIWMAYQPNEETLLFRTCSRQYFYRQRSVTTKCLEDRIARGSTLSLLLAYFQEDSCSYPKSVQWTWKRPCKNNPCQLGPHDQLWYWTRICKDSSCFNQRSTKENLSSNRVWSIFIWKLVNCLTRSKIPLSSGPRADPKV